MIVVGRNSLILDYYTHDDNVNCNVNKDESDEKEKEKEKEKETEQEKNESKNDENDKKNDVDVKDIHNYLPKEKERDIMLSAFLYPWNEFEYKMNLNKKNVYPITMYLLKDSLPGLPKRLAETVVMYHKSTKYLLKLIGKQQLQEELNRRNNSKNLNKKNKNANENTNNKVSIFEKRLLCGLFLSESKDDWEYVLWLVKTVSYIEFNIDVKFIQTQLKPWIYSNLFKEYSISQIKKLKNMDNDDSKVLLGCWQWPCLKNGNQLQQNVEYVKHGIKRDARIGCLVTCLKYLQLCQPNIDDSTIDLFVIEWLDLFSKEFDINPKKNSWTFERTYGYVLDWIQRVS